MGLKSRRLLWSRTKGCDAAALYSAFAAKGTFTSRLLRDALGDAGALETMAERIGGLRDWARERTVSTN